MQWKKEQIILVAIIAVLAVYLIVQKSGRTHYTLPELERIEKSEVTKLSLKEKDSGIILQRKGDGWFIEPQGYAADATAADGLVSGITGLGLSALVSESGNLAVYDLDPEHGIEVAAYAGDAARRSFVVGKVAPSGRHTFVKLDKTRGIFHARGNLRTIFDTTVLRLRDKSVMKIGEDIRSLVLFNGKKKLALEAQEPGPVDQKKSETEQSGKATAEIRWRTGAGKPANDREVDDLISTVRNLSCDDFIEGKEKKDFRHPAYTVTLNGARSYTLSLFRQKDDSYAGVSSEREYPFTLSQWRAKKIMKEFDVLTGAK